MIKTSLACCLFLGAAATSLPAQTSPTSPSATAHHAPTTAAHTTTHAGCVTPSPAPSPKIPALPASAPCVKTLYTVTRIPTTKLVYASPLLSPEVRESLGSEMVTYSLEYVDTAVGTGAPAAEHKFYTVKYTGYLASDGTKFDSSNDHPGGEPITFQYGGHRVIPGWDTGFEGMRVGGKRRLFVPWELAYGEAGRPPVIPAKSELVFDVELVSQSDTPPTPPAGPRSGLPGGRPMPPGAMHPPTATPPAGGASTQTPPAGNPPSSSAPAQPQSTTPPAGNPPSSQPNGTSSSTKPQ